MLLLAACFRDNKNIFLQFFNIYATDENDDLSMSDAHVENLKDNILKTLTEMEKMFKHLDGTSRNVLDYMSHLHHLSSSKSKKYAYYVNYLLCKLHMIYVKSKRFSSFLQL